MFFYTIMNLIITLLENVNKSQTSAGRISLKIKIKIYNFFSLITHIACSSAMMFLSTRCGMCAGTLREA
jgi:hypothetical protein